MEAAAIPTGRHPERIFFAARSFAGTAVSGIGIVASAVLLRYRLIRAGHEENVRRLAEATAP